MDYRRAQISGGTFFFTLVTYQRKKLFEKPKNIHYLRQSFQKIKMSHPFKMNAFVILPDHLHCIWTLPNKDNDFSTRWRLIKSDFTRHCLEHYKDIPSVSRKHKNEQCIWQRRFWEHAIRNTTDFAQHLDYIHFNPVKHGYANAPSDWQYSSFSYYVDKGIYPMHWGCDNKINLNNARE